MRKQTSNTIRTECTETKILCGARHPGVVKVIFGAADTEGLRKARGGEFSRGLPLPSSLEQWTLLPDDLSASQVFFLTRDGYYWIVPFGYKCVKNQSYRQNCVIFVVVVHKISFWISHS